MITDKAFKRAAAVFLSAAMLAGVTTAFAATVSSDSSGKTYSSATGGENAVVVDGSTVTLTSPTVTKSGNSSGDDADFTGTNAAILAKNGATLTITGANITTNGSHANAVFSYGSGTTVNISDSTITTTSNNSGGIMTTGGGTTNASNLNVTTSGNSSAAIRSDRGGGNVTVTGGSYTTSGVGSPAIYSTANIGVTGAALTSNVSEAIVIEGKNSVSLTDCTVSGDNTKTNGQGTTLQNVMIYQSMSGDAATGSASFTMNGGSMKCLSGKMFYVTNTDCTIDLSDVDFTYADGDFLTAAAGAWGSSGSNGGNVTLNAADQTFEGSITVDSISTLNLVLSSGSSYTGKINSTGTAGKVYVEVPSGCTWTLTGDSYITSLTCAAGSIDLNGHTLYVNGTAYTSGTASTGSAVSGSSSGGNNNSGNNQNGQTPPDGQNGQTPPDGQNGQNGQTPPDGQNGQNGQTPPAGQTPPDGQDGQAPADGQFRDVPNGSWFKNAVDFCHEKGIINGTDDTTFAPDKQITRAEMTQMLFSMSGDDPASGSSFKDVASGAWYAKAVAWANAKDVVNGLSDYIFSPESSISRQDLVCMLYRYYKESGMTGLDETADLSTYPDAGDVAEYAQEAMAWAVGNGIVSGIDGSLEPTGTATRAQAAQMLYKFLSTVTAE